VLFTERVPDVDVDSGSSAAAVRNSSAHRYFDSADIALECMSCRRGQSFHGSVCGKLESKKDSNCELSRSHRRESASAITFNGTGI
jgi:hypothetical protein